MINSINTLSELVQEPLTEEQCQQMVEYLTVQMQPFSSSSNVNSTMHSKLLAYIYGLKDISFSYGIVDSGVSRHICFEWSLFIQLHNVNNVSVYLSNQSRIEVTFAGSMKLFIELELLDVLFIPIFQFNLHSDLSALYHDQLCEFKG